MLSPVLVSYHSDMSSRLLVFSILAVLCTSAQVWSQDPKMSGGSVYWRLDSVITIGGEQSLPVQPCPATALDATFQAADGPDHSYTLAINLRNISAETCFVNSQAGGTGISPNPGPDGTQVRICYYCEAGQQKPLAARITLVPGDSVHQIRSWKTTPTDAPARCVTATEMTWDYSYEWRSYVRLSSRSLLKPICSPLMTTDYAVGQLSPETAESSYKPLIQWDNDEDTRYSREHVPLRMRVEDPGHVLLLDERSCPRIFARIPLMTDSSASPTRITHVDEIQNATCKVKPGDGRGKPSVFVMDFDASYALKQAHGNYGEYTFDVSCLTKSKGRYSLAGTTKDFHLSMMDDKLIQRNWGPAVEGIAVSLTLDKDVYEVGGDIPLHIALENFSSHFLIAAPDPGYDPPGVAVQLQDSDGQSIPSGAGAIWSGHGSCRHFIPGDVVPVELKLSQMGFRPVRAGVYRVVVTWTASKNGGCGLASPSDYLTVKSSPVTFRFMIMHLTQK